MKGAKIVFERTKGQRNSKFALFVILAIILLLVMKIIFGKGTEVVKLPEGKRASVDISLSPTQPEHGIERIEVEKERKVGAQFDIEEIRQIQLEELRRNMRTEGPTSRPGKYTTDEELEELEKSGAVLY